MEGGGERVMRTVYLPTANTDSLMLRIESLQAQLNEQVGHEEAPCMLCVGAFSDSTFSGVADVDCDCG